MHGVRVPEEVVQVAEDLLVRPRQEHSEVVRIPVHRVQRERPLDVAPIDELIDLSVRVAGDVAEHRAVRGRRVEHVNRHHREQLLDRPAVGTGLEEREIAEIRVGHRVVEALQVLRDVVHLRDEALELREDRPVQVLRLAALLERQIPAAEQAQRHVERLLRVVIALERVPRGEVLIGLEQIDQRLLGFLRRDRLGNLLFTEGGNAQHVEDEHAVIRHDRAPALRHDRRMLHAGVVAHALDVIDDVVRVLLEGVVDARLEVRLRSVVVDAEAATDVQEFQPGSRLHELRVDPGRLVQRALDDADVRESGCRDGSAGA